MSHFAQAIDKGGAFSLPPNNIWNVPTDTNEVRFRMEEGPGPHRPLKSLTALVFGFKDGRVYGLRTASELSECGTSTFGRVSIRGKKRRCFTGSRMFVREDGSLCQVAVLFISETID